MWTFIAQPGLATAIVDFMNDFSLLAFGLLGLLTLSVLMIAFAATRRHAPQQTEPVAGTAPIPTDHREAA